MEIDLLTLQTQLGNLQTGTSNYTEKTKSVGKIQFDSLTVVAFDGACKNVLSLINMSLERNFIRQILVNFPRAH